MDELKNNEALIKNKAVDLIEKLEINSLQNDDKKYASCSEMAKDYVGTVATINAVKDDKTVQKVTDYKKEELISRASADSKKEQTEDKKAESAFQKAIYGINEGVAEYAGIKKELPQRMQAVLFFILAIIQGAFLIILGIPTSIFNIFADCVNSMVKRLATLTKEAKIIVKCALILAALFILYKIVQQVLVKYGIILPF